MQSKWVHLQLTERVKYCVSVNVHTCTHTAYTFLESYVISMSPSIQVVSFIKKKQYNYLRGSS